MATAGIVRVGDEITIHYQIRLPDGTEIENTRNSEPITFEAGSKKVLKAISQAVVGMTDGEKKTFTLNPKDAFGEHNPKLVLEVNRDQVPEKTKVGDQLVSSDGETILVKEISGQKVIIDGNHPLAGKELIVELELLNKQSTSAD